MDIDWPTGVITIYKTDSFMSFQGGNIYDMDTNAFRLAVMEQEAGEQGIIWPNVFSHNTVVTLAGIDYARIIEVLSPYTITFDDTGGAWVCNLLNSNNNVLDVTNLTSVQVRSNNSAGLVGVREIQNTAYASQVALDAVGGTSGTQYPIGTHANPSNNATDSVTIANARGIEVITLHGSYTLTAGDNVNGFKLRGENAITTFLTIEAGADVFNTQFASMFITNSTFDGNTYVDHCGLTNVTGITGYVERSLLTGSIQIGGIDNTYFIDCKSGCVGLGTTDLPDIDLSGGERHVAFRNFAGPVKFSGNTHADTTVCLDIDSGAHVTIEASNTAGTIYIRGTAAITNNSSMTVNRVAAIEPYMLGEALTTGEFLALK